MLDCFTTAADEPSTPIDLVTLDRFSDWIAGLDGPTQAWLRANEFRGHAGRFVIVPGADGRAARVVFGMGAGEDAFIATDLPALLQGGTYHIASDTTSGRVADPLLAWALGCYRFNAYKSGTPARLPRLRVPADATLAEVSRVAEGLYFTRDLVNTPSNDMGPAELERAARDLAERHGAAFTSIVGDMLLEQNFPMIHAVGRASSRAPRLLDLKWGDESAPKVTLVGKGVCFDSGGLNIKPAGGMELMKKDMGGAAHVLGLAHMIMSLRIPVRLRVLIPAVENAISGNAFRPGDVYRARNGSTVEIGNTDAEGRLVLADAMSLGDEESPDLMIVMATLTGAARIALGSDIVPYYTQDEGLAREIAETAGAVHDPVWRMPLYKPYMMLLESRVADINHIAQGRFAGSITAALFLSRFVSAAKAWAHYDIYAWNPQARPGRPIGAEAQAIRGLLRLMQTRFAAAPEPDASGGTAWAS